MAGQNEFTPFNRWRFLTYYEQILSLKKGYIPKPRMAIVYPSYNCNQNCDYCFYTEERGQFKGAMYDLEQFKYLLRKLRELGVEGVEYCGGGEPFTNPSIYEATQYGLKLGLKFGALTNGTLLKPDMLELIRLNFSYIRFSIDSFDKSRYVNKRKGSESQFDTMTGNLSYLAQNRHGKNKLKIGVKLLLTKDNFTNMIADIDEAAFMCDNMGIDSLQIKVAEKAGEGTNDVFGVGEELDHIVQECRDKYNVPILAGTGKTHIKEQCWLNPVQLTVDPLGDVYLCCYFQHRKESHRLCNIFSEDILSLWGAPRHKEKLRSIKVPECNVWNCRFHGYHKIANAIIDDCMQLQFC